MKSLSLEQRTLIERAVKKNNFNYIFSNRSNSLYINYAFYECCYHDKDFDFVDSIIKLGVTEFTIGCVYGASLHKHYDLLYQILLKYGKSFNINILSIEDFDISKHLNYWASVEKYFPLYQLTIDLLLNHTQIILKDNKCFLTYNSEKYEIIYNKILSSLLDTSDLNFLNAIIYLSKRKFPISEYNIIQIKKQNLECYFSQRLNHIDKIPYKGIAQRFLLREHYIDIELKKLQIYEELRIHLNIPSNINEHLLYFFNNGQPSSKIQINNTLDYQFLSSIKNKPYIHKFFMKYFDYSKFELHSELINGLTIHHTNKKLSKI